MWNSMYAAPWSDIHSNERDSAFNPVIQIHKVQTKNLKSSIKVRRNMSNDVYNQSLACFYHKSSIMFQLENSFVFRNERERS